MRTEARSEIWRMIDENDLESLLKAAGQLHGHYCAGLALGVIAGAEMVRRLKVNHIGMEDVLAIVETNNCFSDGIQFATGCSFGNNALIYLDLGKSAASLVDRSGNGIRALVKPHSWEGDRELEDLFDKIVIRREGTPEDERRFAELAERSSFQMLSRDPEELMDFKPVHLKVPEYAKIFDTEICTACGEPVMASRTVRKGENVLCYTCAGREPMVLDGNGIRTGGL